jgi:hypothetical protein
LRFTHCPTSLGRSKSRTGRFARIIASSLQSLIVLQNGLSLNCFGSRGRSQWQPTAPSSLCIDRLFWVTTSRHFRHDSSSWSPWLDGHNLFNKTAWQVRCLFCAFTQSSPNFVKFPMDDTNSFFHSKR